MFINLYLVEDHAVVRQGVKALLESDPEIRIVGEASNGAEAFNKLGSVLPDILLMDMNMPVMNGLECARLVKRDFPSIKILILSMHDHESYLIDLLDAGVDGYILKSSPGEELIFAIRKIAMGGIYLSPEFTLSMLAKYKEARDYMSNHPKTNIDITEREMDVLQLIADGLTNTEIAQKLYTSVRTIENRRKRLLEKTGSGNTATLIRFAILNGLIR
jgi:DNA-binding NarL/FixJ family response regulator